MEALPAEIRQRFDLVGFDPRGVGSSTPAVRCNSDAEADAERADPQVDYSPAGVAHIEDTEKKFVQRCVDRMGKDFLANVGTASVVKDLDALRAALGDDKLTYLGYSYGTLIGSAYAEAYPDKVRAMILDGAVDPDADPIQSDVDQTAGFQKAFDDFATDCAKNAGLPARHRSGQGGRRLPPPGRPSGGQAGPDAQIREGSVTATPITGTMDGAVLADPVEAPAPTA